MRADDVVRAVVARLRTDAELTAALGGEHIYRAGAHRKVQIPSVEWTIVSDTYRESTERVLVQFGEWAKGWAQAAAIEGRIRALLHRELPELFTLPGSAEGLLMWSRYEDSRDMGDPEPGVVNRTIDFHFEPAREE